MFTRSLCVVIGTIALAGCAGIPTKDSGSETVSATLNLLRQGKQREAEALLGLYLSRSPGDQAALFYLAACTRSRFEKEEADLLFKKVANIDPTSVYGLVAEYMISIDSNQDIDRKIGLVQELADDYPGKTVIRWMLAVALRERELQTKDARETVSLVGKATYQFVFILRDWNPGPVLVHQTFANMLDDIGRHREALYHRLIAIELEPAGWSYQGLWWTLYYLGDYESAEEAIEKAMTLDAQSAGLYATNQKAGMDRLFGDLPR